ncbi:MAG: Lrp/AsnC family transcriptional regulator [Lachnospiraceae bacterium]|nr:Lrp/AsnC family transcriptional regulator [Lachnospiraceae bacterium]MDD3796790.1 Lrp/AsnC family transcriptional regulator [Lachnospiraceae bacterium]
MYDLDGVDCKIIELLQNNARISLKDIAAEVFLTSPAVSARIEKLEQNGVIEGYHAHVRKEAFLYQIKAFINLKMDPVQKNELYSYVKSIKNVLQCDCVTGDYVIFLEVIFHNTEELDQFIDALQKYGETKTQIVFSTAVEHRGLPLEVNFKTGSRRIG